jgi:hypothetical protein
MSTLVNFDSIDYRFCLCCWGRGSCNIAGSRGPRIRRVRSELDLRVRVVGMHVCSAAYAVVVRFHAGSCSCSCSCSWKLFAYSAR